MHPQTIQCGQCTGVKPVPRIGGQALKAGIWRAQRDVFGAVMRGEKTPEMALPELIKATEDFME